MAATAQAFKESDHTVGQVYTGSWTTDSTKGDHTLTLPRHVMYFQVLLDSGGTNPNLLIKHADETDETYLLDGGPTQALATSPTDATGVTLTNLSNGTCTVVVDSNSQVNSGTNQWFAFVKPF